MANKLDELKTYAFTDNDINLITFALRRLSDKSAFKTTKEECMDLIRYIEREAKERKAE